MELHIADVGKTVEIMMRNPVTGTQGEGARQGLRLMLDGADGI